MTRWPGLSAWPRDVLFLLAAMGIALFCLQYFTLPKFAVLSPNLSYITPGRFLEEARQSVDVDAYDGILLLLLLVPGLLLVALELTRSRLSLFLGTVFTSQASTLLLLASSSLVFVRFYLTPGDLSWAGDAGQHIIYAHITAQALASGEFPIWTNYLGTGSPYLQFYGFLFFYLVGAIEALAHTHLDLSVKIVLTATHVASGLGMYALVYTLTRSRRAAFVGGLAYVLSFWHTQQILLMGRLPLSLFYALLPWPFQGFEGALKSRRWTPMLGAGLALASLVLTHPAYGMWAVILLALYMAARLAGASSPPDRARALVVSAAIVAIGVGFSAYLVLPMWLDRVYTGLYKSWSLSGVADPTWRHIFGWSNFRFWLVPLPADQHHWYGGYVGLSLVGLTLAAAAGWWATRSRLRGPTLAAGLCLGVVLLIIFGYRWPLVGSLPLVHTLSSGRYLLFVVFFLALSAGLGVRSLFLWKPGRWPRRALTTWILLLIVFDLGPTTFQYPYLPLDAEKDPTGYEPSLFEPLRADGLPFHARGELPNYRILWAMGNVHYYTALGRLYYNTLTPITHAPHPGDLRAQFIFIDPLQKYLSNALRRIPEDASELFSAPNIDTIGGGLALVDAAFVLATQHDKEVIALRWPTHSPILVTDHIRGFPSGGFAAFTEGEAFAPWAAKNLPEVDDLDYMREIFPVIWTIEKTGIDPEAPNTCRQLLILDLPDEQDLGTDPTVEVLQHRVWNQRVELTVRVSSPCFARLAYAYFPHLQVLVDGVEVRPMQTATRFIALQLDEGEHRIELVPYLSSLRRTLLALDLVFLVVALTVWRWEARSRSKHSP